MSNTNRDTLTDRWGAPVWYASRVMRTLAPYVPAADLRGFATVARAQKLNADHSAILVPSLGLEADRLLSLSWRVGRQQANQSFDAGILTFSYPVDGVEEVAEWSTGDKVSVGVAPGAWLFLNDNPDTGGDPNKYQRGFAGTVSDLQLDYRRLAPGRPLQAVLSVTVVGPKARAGQLLIGDEPWPVETIAARKTRIETLAEVAWPDELVAPMAGWAPPAPDTTDTYVIARDVDRSSALDLYEELAGDVGAGVFESTRYAYRILWADIAYREDRTPIVTLRPEEVAATAQWGMSMAGLVNRYTVTYGPDDDRHEVTVTDPASIARFGEYAGSRQTQLRDVDKAQRLAQLTVGRNSRPTWAITRLDVDMLDLALPRVKARELLCAEIGDLIELEGLPTSAPGPRHYYVEGSELTVSTHDVRLTVYVSEAGRTGAPLAWEDLPSTLAWVQVDPTLTWLQAAGWYVQPTDEGRWSDVPGNVSWWTLAPGEVRQDGDPRGPTWSSYPEDP